VHTPKWVSPLIVLAAVIAFFALGGFRWVLFHTLFYSIGAHEDALRSRANAEPAGRALAVLCETCKDHPDWFENEPPWAPAWTPAAVLALRPQSVDIGPEGAGVEFGGGFHHFGYGLTRDQQAPKVAGRTAWVLNFGREDVGSEVVARFDLPTGNKLSEQQFIDQTMAEFDRRIAANYDARISGSPSAFPTIQRCQFAIKHHVIERLRQAIRESARKNPQDWRDTLLVYVMDREVDPAVAPARLRQWAASMADFSGWHLAAVAFDSTGDLDAAEDAVKEACRFPADDPHWLSMNAPARSLGTCCRLYEVKKYATCAMLCDNLLAGKEKACRQEISAIREACRHPDSAVNPCVSTKIYRFDPFEGIDLQAIRTGKPTSAPKTAPDMENR
jgi:hypothetical protein